MISAFDFEKIDGERDDFTDALARDIETQLRKLGLRLIRINIEDIDISSRSQPVK